MQFDVVGADVLVVSVFHAKTAGDHAELGKAELFIEPAGAGVGGDNGIELQDPIAERRRGFDAVPHQFFTDAQARLSADTA